MKLIPLCSTIIQGKFTQVSDEDYDYLMQWEWWLRSVPKYKSEYAVRRENRRQIYMSRFIMQEKEANIFIDHKDGNGLNNQRENLRRATISQNNANKRATGNSSFLGVHYKIYKNKKRKDGTRSSAEFPKWYSSIRINGKSKFIGHFPTEEEAARAYDFKAKEVHGEFARLNFP